MFDKLSRVFETLIEKIPEVSISYSNTSKANGPDWAMIFATIAGPILGAIMTVWSVRRTIRYEVAMRENDKAPKLCFDNFDIKYVKHNLRKIKPDRVYSIPQKNADGKSCSEKRIEIVVSNYGLGMAFNVNVAYLLTDDNNQCFHINSDNDVNIDRDTSVSYEFYVKLYDDPKQYNKDQKIKIVLFYRNIYSRLFKQEVEVIPEFVTQDEKRVFLYTLKIVSKHAEVFRDPRKSVKWNALSNVYETYLSVVSELRSKEKKP